MKYILTPDKADKMILQLVEDYKAMQKGFTKGGLTGMYYSLEGSIKNCEFLRGALLKEDKK